MDVDAASARAVERLIERMMACQDPPSWRERLRRRIIRVVNRALLDK